MSRMAKSRKRTESGGASVMNPVETPAGRMADRSNLDPDRIAARAYELYLARGGSDGFDQQDWFAAEQELNGERQDEEE